MSNLKYSENRETLTALVSYLGLTKSKSRSASGVAEALGLGESDVKAVLAGFPSLFRCKEKYYTLHFRYGLRHIEKKDDDFEPLPREYLVTLMEMIDHRSDQEVLEERAVRQDRSTRRGVWVAAFSLAPSSLLLFQVLR